MHVVAVAGFEPGKQATAAGNFVTLRAARLGHALSSGYPGDIFMISRLESPAAFVLRASLQRCLQVGLLLCACCASAVLAQPSREAERDAIERDIRLRTEAFNAEHRAAWAKVQTRADWEAYRDQRIAALRTSLGELPAPGPVRVEVTRRIPLGKIAIENMLYESRPGVWVAGNLYVPDPLPTTRRLPGILLAHAHHRGKTQSELQDMGMTWAHAGCAVLVIDQLGYGERRTHPFATEKDYAKTFPVSRQDYYFRYDTGLQLQLLGDSLMGWFVSDLSRGVDVLLARPEVDPQRILLLGGVAGGGDPAGVTAALDPRIACCVPFNFGGPQPETKYPLPDDAETSFNVLLFTYWDSTRGLRLGARDDFPHWVIVASTAPRSLIHAHEFAWDQERDPVWNRYQKIWGDYYGAADRVSFTHGYGNVRKSSSEASHCTNIGPVHRKKIHEAFAKWFQIHVDPNHEFSAPRPSEELQCWTDAAREKLAPQTLNQRWTELAQGRSNQARAKLQNMSRDEQRAQLRNGWRKILGPIDIVPRAQKSLVVREVPDRAVAPDVQVHELEFAVDSRATSRLTLHIPKEGSNRKPVVIAIAQGGAAEFAKQRKLELEKLLAAGIIVAIPELRGANEYQAGSSRGRTSADTQFSVSMQVFGETLLGQRLRDLRAALAECRRSPQVDPQKIALWGDSFAPVLPADTDFHVPHGIEPRLTPAEPLGQLLALLAALYEDDLHAISISGGILSYQQALSHYQMLIPHDAAVPGAIAAGDLPELVAAAAQRPLRMSRMVNERNQRVAPDRVRAFYESALTVRGADLARIEFAGDESSAADWLIQQMK